VNYELLIVDEYQDLNACDLEVLKLIAERGCTIIGAGDDDQSIYSFRKAAPEGIRRFPDDYGDAADYPLSITQRCGSRIIEWASYIIGGDPKRPKERPPLTPTEGSPPGECALLSFADENEEAMGLGSLIERLVNAEKIPPGEILVLLRGDHNEAFSRPLKKALHKFDFPFSNPEAVKLMLEEPPNRSIIELFRLLVHRDDSLAWAALLRLSTGIGEIFFDYIYRLAQQSRSQFGRTLLETYAKGFQGGPTASSARATTLINKVWSWLEANQINEDEFQGDWGAWILERVGHGVVPTPTSGFAELLTALDSLAESQQGLGRYLSQIAPLGKDRAQAESEGVRILTMGRVKGLTVEATIMMALEDGVVPRPDCELAEERRLLYVAMTRAKKYLFGTWARSRRGQTAWSGKAQIGKYRRFSHFLDGGPVKSQDGAAFLRERWHR
jgi:DNA helicase-2/ATP-dependent DNA helicase PcrA